MCTGNLIQLWCPCTNTAHSRESREPFAYDALGHTIAREENKGVYILCQDAWRQSGDFFSHPVGERPDCPNGPIQFEHMHFRSTTLCNECLQAGCELVWEKRGMYGHITSSEKLVLKEEKRDKKEPDAFVFPAVPNRLTMQPREETTMAAAKPRRDPPLRTIDLREEDEAEIRWMKAWRDLEAAEKAMEASERQRRDGGRRRREGKEQEQRGQGLGYESGAGAREDQPWVHRARPQNGHRQQREWSLKAWLGRQ